MSFHNNIKKIDGDVLLEPFRVGIKEGSKQGQKVWSTANPVDILVIIKKGGLDT